jgi:hypothetical protein
VIGRPLATSEATVRSTWAATLVFVVTAVLAAALPAGPMRPLAAAVALACFAVGCGLYLAGYARAVQRSRLEEISMAALTFLAGETAPPDVRRRLLAATAVLVVVAVGTAAWRPFTSLAFGILAPVLGIGAQTFWASRFGVFPRRKVKAPKRQRR